MAAVVEAVSDVVESVGDAVGAVAETVSDVVSEAGQFVEQVGQAVGNTIEAIAEDPIKALPMIAVAIVAPELAPLLEVSTPVAGMVLNTGIQLAEGRDPAQIAMNLGTSAITYGITDAADISTGNRIIDNAIGRTASQVIQGQDVGTALGSTIGGALIGAGTRGVAGEIRDVTGLADERAPAPVTDYSQPAPPATIAGLPIDEVTKSQVFQDAVNYGFLPSEAYAIAQGQLDKAGPAYAPTAGVTAQFLPGEGPQVEFDLQPSETPLVEQPTKEQLQQDLLNEKITQEEYDTYLDYLANKSALGEYQDPKAGLDLLQEAGPIEAESKTADQGPFSGVIGTEKTEDGNTLYRFDDDSTLTVDDKMNVVDFTEAPDEEEIPDEVLGEETAAEEPDEKGGIPIGFSRIGKAGTQARIMRRGISKTKTTKVPGTAGSYSGGLTTSGITDFPGTSAGSGLTPGLASGTSEYSLIGEYQQEPQQMATGGTPAATTGVYDLSYTAASPFSQGKDIMILKPGMTKANINYALPGYPFGKDWKLAAKGGSITDEHKPEFYSEGGLNSIKNRYVKGAGDGTSDSIPAMLANGEFVIPADVVSSLGNGDNDSGAKVLDEFLKTIREHKRRADPKKLPPDSKGALGYLLEAKKRVKK